MIIKRLTHDGYDELYSLIDINFFEKDTIFDKVEAVSENILIDGKTVELDIDINVYNDILNSATTIGDASKALAKKIYEDFKFCGKKLPRSIMYSKETWTYLNLTIFKELTKNKYFSNDKNNIDKIQRYYFNSGGISKIDRTGLRYLWVLVDLTFDDDIGYKLFDVAWDFLDPFKAVQECVIGRNPMILKAFAKAILDMNCDPKIKNKINRTRVPKHIRNYACANLLDSYDSFNYLVDTLKGQIQIVINL